jgi:hypothetical protein
MRISNLGLAPAEVDAFMSEVFEDAPTVPATAGPQAYVDPAPSKPLTTVGPVTPAKSSTVVKDGGTLKNVGTPTPKIEIRTVNQPKKGLGPVLAAAGAGFLVGGPVGAAVGAGALLLVRKK